MDYDHAVAIHRKGSVARPALEPVVALRSGPLEHRPHLCFFLHDEVVVHTPAGLAEPVADAVRAAAAEAGGVLFGDAPGDFPLHVAVAGRYSEAKG